MKKQNKKLSRKTPVKRKYPKIVHFARFVPALIISIFASYLWAQPYVANITDPNSNDVLAYATNTSPAGLLSATNTQRINGGVGALTANSKLASAAQAKANDMVARDYWSHVTPDGKQPWAFITAAGYQYVSAGENLAYGFLTSGDTITGWMNSPSHRENLMNGKFTEVGFGIANSANFVGNGKQTIVVAMYAKPQSAAPPTKSPGPAAQSKPASKPKPIQNAEPAPTVESNKSVEEKKNDKEEPKEEKIEEEPIAVADTTTPPTTAAPTKVSRVQLLTGGSAIWSATFVILGVCAIALLWMIHKGVRIGKWLKSSEKFVIKHLHLDLTVIAIVYLGIVLLSSSGTIR